MKNNIVRIKNLKKVFKDHAVLDNVNIEIQAGEIIGIVGPNGGGKSTLLNLIAGLLKPTDGEVNVSGFPASTIAMKANGSVGLVLAKPGLYPLLSGWENLDYFSALFGYKEKQTREKANDLLELFELTEHMGKATASWSTGMQQKLSLVRALILSPKLLLLDEPTANLDPAAAASMFEQIENAAKSGIACVLITHDLQIVKSVSDRVLFLKQTIRREVKKPKDKDDFLEIWNASFGGNL